MKTSASAAATQSPARPPQAPARPDDLRGAPSAAEQQPGERFARLLLEKSAQPGDRFARSLLEKSAQPGERFAGSLLEKSVPPGERFARLPREESGQPGEGCERDADPSALAALASAGAFAVLPRRPENPAIGEENLPTPCVSAETQQGARPQAVATAQGAAHASADTGVTASRAAIEAALNAEPGHAVAASGADETWTATVRAPQAVPIEVRATRVTPEGAPSGQAAWSLTIASPAVEVALLTRHAPRLSERLRTRAIEHTHVRIQRDDEENP
jgi:hypothetical protein